MSLENLLEIIDESPIDLDYWENICGHSEYEIYYKIIDQKLKTDPSFAFKYAEKNGRLTSEYEKIFLKSARFAFLYSLWVLKGRLPSKIEKVFEKNPEEAYLYCCNVCKKRLPKKLENSFKYSPKHAYNYSNLLNKRLNEEIEVAFVKDTVEERGEYYYEDFCFTYLYSKNIIKGRFPPKIHKSLFLRYNFDENCSKRYLKNYLDENH